MRRTIFTQFLLLAIVGSAVSPSRAEEPPKRPRQATHEMPTIQLAWKPDEKGAQIASIVYVAPAQCARGAPIMRMVASEPGKFPNLNNLVLLAGDSGLTTLDIGKASEVKGAQLESYFATDSDIVVLLSGADELKLEKLHYRIIPSPGSSEAPSEIEQTVNRAEQHRYILHFDFSGDLRQVHKMDDPFEWSVVAEFASGKLLLGGMPVGGKVQWAIANSDGTVLSVITLANETRLREHAATSFKPNGSVVRSTAQSMFGMTQIVPYRDEVVVIPPGNGGILYVISESGEVQTLHVHLPTGLEQGSAIPSTTGLYLRANNPKKAEKGLDSESIYNINMETGAALQQYETGEVKPSSVLCVDGNDFIALHSDRLSRGSPK